MFVEDLASTSSTEITTSALPLNNTPAQSTTAHSARTMSTRYVQCVLTRIDISLLHLNNYWCGSVCMCVCVYMCTCMYVAYDIHVNTCMFECSLSYLISPSLLSLTHPRSLLPSYPPSLLSSLPLTLFLILFPFFSDPILQTHY
jgi:hypothetical protein